MRRPSSGNGRRRRDARPSVLARFVLGIGVLATGGCAGQTTTVPQPVTEVDLIMRSSFQSRGAVTLERVLDRDDMQRLCSAPLSSIDTKSAAKLQTRALESIVYPADGQYLGDWKKGEQTAQNGRGLQFTDPAGTENGGNCYACHRITPTEVSFGTLGPSLYNYGKLRGNGEAILKYTWAKIYDPHAYRACSNMPRFGHNQILTAQQIRDVMALLLDPLSPVNQ